MNSYIDQQAQNIEELKQGRAKIVMEKEQLEMQVKDQKTQILHLQQKINNLTLMKELLQKQLENERQPQMNQNSSSSQQQINERPQEQIKSQVQPDINLLDRFLEVALQQQIKSRIMNFNKSSTMKFFIRFKSNEFAGNASIFKSLARPFFIVAQHSAHSTSFFPNQFISAYLNLESFNWKEMTVFQYKVENQLFLIETFNGTFLAPYIKQPIQVQVRFNNKKHEMILSKRGDIEMQWYIDLNDGFDIYTLH
ncbi:hypothetical protein FGO68_gene14203 [Halteria grandinella]|uniref:Uncharacterized protein n=1 Tax=Halteria grandinella TaxID=5974 RepID=A0A8J8NDL6_HALGN|nr:hypothetical protein FGO68_gene14203 [Halteria grandinella]